MRLRELFANPFFPDQGFAWVFAIVLLVCSALAAVYDTRKAIIPKWITLGTLGIGVVLNVIRGAWLGSQGVKVWWLPEGSVGIGAADGFLFSLAGFAVGFGIFLLMFMFNVCGGGDVKLMTALSAWLGPMGAVLLLIVSTAALYVWVIGSVVFGNRSVKSMRKTAGPAQSPQKGRKARQFRITFSFPAAVTSFVLMFWVFGEELGVRAAKPPIPQTQGEARDREPTKQPS